jgi:O-antigen ligase
LFGVLQLFSYVILALCVVLLFVYRFTVYRDLGVPGHVFFAFLLAYIAIGAPIGLHADPEGFYGRAYEVRLQLAGGLIVAAAAVAARGVLLAYGTRTTLRTLLLLSALIPLAVGLSWFYPEFYRVEVGRIRDLSRAAGTFGNPNDAAGASCLVAAIAFSFMVVERSKLLSIGVILAAATAVYLTGSRGGFLILLLLAIAQVFITPGFKRIVSFLVVGALVGGLVFAAYQLATTNTTAEQSRISRTQNLLRVIQGEVTDETTGGRFHLAMGGVKAWMESPVLGNGLGTQRRIDAVTLGPHNEYIRIGGEAGVIPLALFLVALASLAWNGWKCHVPAVRTFSVGVALVVASLCFTSHNVLSSRENPLLLGIAFGLLAGCRELKAAAEGTRRKAATMAARRTLAPGPTRTIARRA